MKTRCDNPDYITYHHYGGRGITYCQKWDRFEHFFADMGECPRGFSLERIDVDGNYEPSNCEWIPLSEQHHNKQNTVRITYLGRTQSMSLWAKEFGLNYNTLRYRIKRGWPIEKALTTPSGVAR